MICNYGINSSNIFIYLLLGSIEFHRYYLLDSESGGSA